MSAGPTSPDLSIVQLVDEEQIVAHGSAGTTWWVRVNDSWASAATLPGAVVTALDTGPGTVWRRLVELKLPRGTRVLKVESGPLVQHRTPLEYLARRPTTSRKVRKSEFSVGPGGRLVRSPTKTAR